MSRLPDDDSPRLPFPLSEVSNGEWCPRPPTAKQLLAARILATQADRRARRLGLSRRDFLRTAAGAATAFMVLNQVHGLDQWGDAAVLPVRRSHCDDLDGGRELLRHDYFIVDVQTHHVDLTLPFLEVESIARQVGCLRFLPPNLTCTVEGLQLLGQANYVKEIFVDSETDVGVVSGIPTGTILPVETMKATRDLVNEVAGSERALSQAMIDPRQSPGAQTAIDSLEHQVRDNGARAIKCYTGSGAWWLDDEQVSYPMLAEARRLGLGLINVHKGFPQLLGPMADLYVQSRDLPKVTADWPDLEFCAYHSGYFPGRAIAEFIGVVQTIPRKQRKNIYAEIGSAFAVAFLEGPDQAAHLLGQLLRTLGSKHILWGTDSIWWGSPQWQIDAFKALRIPPAMQEEFGYPALTRRVKRRILGLNAARLYGLQRRKPRCSLRRPDGIDRLREAQGGFRAGRSLRAYGPRSRREFLALLRHEARGAG
jgi:predicted TIM-barrel fold metal-dependent hydrolase